MPAHNPLLVPGFTQDATGDLKPINTSADLALGVGPVHLTIIGLVILSVAGLALLHKLGFRFAVTVGGR